MDKIVLFVVFIVCTIGVGYGLLYSVIVNDITGKHTNESNL